jgi:hypothetical protein
MDHAMQRAHLAQAERHVAAGIRQIEQQERIVADLDRNGHDATVAWNIRPYSGTALRGAT